MHIVELEYYKQPGSINVEPIGGESQIHLDHFRSLIYIGRPQVMRFHPQATKILIDDAEELIWQRYTIFFRVQDGTDSVGVSNSIQTRS